VSGKRTYRLAYDSEPRRARDLLRFGGLKENAPRKGFVDHTAYDKLMGHVEESWLRSLLATAYTFGFRGGELLELRVGLVDLIHCTICLDPGAPGTTAGESSR